MYLGEQRFAEPLGILSSTLGEAPMWDPQRQEISLVDIERCTHYRLSQKAGAWDVVWSTERHDKLGSVVPLNDGAYLFCQGDGIWRGNGNQNDELIASLPFPPEHYRINDAKLSPDGSLWCGIMHREAKDGHGSLWKFRPDGSAVQLLGGLTIPNGLDWDDDRFWFVDGPHKWIKCYRWSANGVSDELMQVDTSHTPDGLTIDEAGNLFVALWGGGKVVQFSPDGRRLGEILVEAPHTTSVAFIGDSLSTLAITTATYLVGVQEMKRFPRSGDVFLCETNHKGRLPNQIFS